MNHEQSDARSECEKAINRWQFRQIVVTLRRFNGLLITLVEEFGCLQPHKKMLKLQNPPQILRLLGIIPRF